jgi:hypothetical protein
MALADGLRVKQGRGRQILPDAFFPSPRTEAFSRND